MSRNIPKIVEPEVQASAETATEPEPSANVEQSPAEKHKDFLEAHKQAFENRFKRRHSVDPNKTFWQTRFSDQPDSEQCGARLRRRGSTPANWSNPQGRQDRFQQIVDRMMNANDDDLLSGLMDREFSPFLGEEFKNENLPARQNPPREGQWVHWSSSSKSKGSDPPEEHFSMTYGNDKKGFVKIPFQLFKHREQDGTDVKVDVGGKDVSMTTDKEKGNDSKDERKATVLQRQSSQTGEVSREYDKETTEKSNIKKSEKDTILTSKSAPTEKEKLSQIKEIENSFKDTCAKIEKFKEPNGKKTLKEFMTLEEFLMRALMSLDAIQAKGSKCVREARKAMVIQVQYELQQLENIRKDLDEQ